MQQSPPVADEYVELAAEVFALLADPTRIRIILALRDGELPVNRLAELVGKSPAAVSQHLAKLRLAGWIDSRRDGRRLLYRVTDPHIVTLVHQAVEHILDLRN